MFNKDDWKKANDAEKYAYLKSQPIKIVPITGLNPEAKVGDDNAMVTVHQAERGFVVTSPQFIDPSAAILGDKESMRIWCKLGTIRGGAHNGTA
ncbi:hypothetical protein GD1_151 [Paraglaciecola Antarctic GD virus 1]|nr:hypothetical protein GD1_151 [Paraglaciecola Antarctic GD virus 1]